MEKNTVLLSLDRYNELREFKEKLESGKKLVTIQDYGAFMGSKTTTYLTDDKIAAKLTERVKNLSETNSSLKESNSEFKNQISALSLELDKYKPTEKQITIKDVENMSLIQLIKWKFKSNK